VASGVSKITYAAYESAGSGTLLTFDKSGKVLSTNSFSGQPIAMGFNKTLGLFIYTGNNIYSLASK
jgi:hypothetical protein